MNIRNLLGVLAFLSIIACKDDPVEPIEKVEPVAAFEIASTDNLTVSFTNNSTNATTYAWEFGDGKSSTDENPTYTYEEGGSYTVKLTATNGDLSNSTSKAVVVEEPYRTSGYVLSSVASSSAGATYYTGYYEDLPSGDIDLTQKQAFQRITFRIQHKGFLYGFPSNNEPGLAKFAIDAKTDELVTVSEIPLFDFPASIIILNDELAIFSSFSTTEIQTFNPMTMELLGSVDMSGAKEFPEGEEFRKGYNSLTYNETTGKIYATSYINDPGTPPFYDAQEVWVEVIDATSLKREKTIVHPDAQYALFRGNINTVIDEMGNTYLLCQGSYGIDGQIGPTAQTGSRPQIIKINTSSEFEIDYAFNPINLIGFQNNFFQLITSMVYAGNNKAYAVGTAQADSPEIIALLAKLGAGTITTEEYDQLVALVLFDESMSILEIDLINKTATQVTAAPKTAGFAYPFMYNYDDKVYAQMTADGGAFNGFYVIDPSDNSAEPLFNIVAGGLSFHFIDLSKGFE